HCKICGAIAPHEVVPYRNEGRHGDPIFDGLSVAVCEQFQSSWVINPPSNSGLLPNLVPNRTRVCGCCELGPDLGQRERRKSGFSSSVIDLRRNSAGLSCPSDVCGRWRL